MKSEQSLFVEETLPDSSYQTLWQDGTPQEAMQFLSDSPSPNRLELWSKSWAAGPKGFAPMAWRDKDSQKVMVTTTFRMLCLDNWTKKTKIVP